MPTLIYDAAEIDFERPGKHHYQVAFPLDGNWGFSLLPVTVINGLRDHGGKDAPPGVACFGGTHGNEYEGQVAIKRLCHDLDPGSLAGTVILVPQLSQSACVAGTRDSPLDRVNMNRAFPGSPRGSVSYRIAHFVKTRIFPKVGVVLDIHSGGKEAIFPVCTSFHPIDDPKQRAEIVAVARLFDPPFVLIYSSQMASGLLTDEAEAEGKITVGGEFGYAESTSRLGVSHVYEGIKNVLKRYGQLDGEIVKVRPADQPPPRFLRAANLQDYVPCPRDGIWEPAVDLGARINEGDLLGRLHDFSDHSSAALEIRARRSGVLALMHFGSVCAKGLTLYSVAQEVPIDQLLQ